MLLHVVGAGELLGATLEGARNGLLSCVNLRVARGVTGGCECLVAPMAFPIAAGITLSGPV